MPPNNTRSWLTLANYQKKIHNSFLSVPWSLAKNSLCLQKLDRKIKYDQNLVQGLFFHAFEIGLADETDEDLAMSAKSKRANQFNQRKTAKPSTTITITITKSSKEEVGASGANEGKQHGYSKIKSGRVTKTGWMHVSFLRREILKRLDTTSCQKQLRWWRNWRIAYRKR